MQRTQNILQEHKVQPHNIWKLKDKESPWYVNWSIKARGHAFSSGGRACDLCLSEKLAILTADQNTMLNKADTIKLTMMSDQYRIS